MAKQVRWRLKNVPDTFSLESKPQGRNAMADELIFYTNPMSRGQIVRWMLEEVGAPYEPRILDYGTTMKDAARSEEHTSELQSLMRISYAVFCLKKTKDNKTNNFY